MPGKKRLLITGARGFIGKSLVEYFQAREAARYDLFYPFHSELELTDAGAVMKFVKEKKIDVIIHCANVGGSRKTDYDEGRPDVAAVNLKMFFAVARCGGLVDKILYFGSGAEYSRQHYVPLMSEEYFDTHVPGDPYGFSKYVCAKYSLSAENIIDLRLFGVYGRHEDHAIRFISNAILKNIFGLPIVINQNVFFDYLYMDDLSRITAHFIEHGAACKACNVCTGAPVDLVSIAGIINGVGSHKSPVKVLNEGLNTEYSGSNGKLLKELGKFRFTALKDAISEMYSCFSRNMDSFDRTTLENDQYLKHCRTR